MIANKNIARTGILSLGLLAGLLAGTTNYAGAQIKPQVVPPSNVPDELVSMQFQEMHGLLTLTSNRGNCSASLLSNEWAITAAHCIEAEDGSKMMPAVINLAAAWKTGQREVAVQIESFRPFDVAIVKVGRPFAVHGTTTGFKAQVFGSEQFPYKTAYSIELFGQGINTFAGMVGGVPVPTTQDGQFRSADAKILESDATSYGYRAVNGKMAGGDSGGPSYMTSRTGRLLMGVHSTCMKKCLSGMSCQGWTWVTETTTCHDAPVLPVWGKILQFVKFTTAPPDPPVDAAKFIGTFSKTPVNYQPLWVYGITNEGKLLWYRQEANTDSFVGPKEVGNGWTNFKDVIPGGGNRIYALAPDGALQWYRHDGFNTGAFNWQGPNLVGNGWQNFRKVIASGDGVVYAITQDGALQWYRHDGFNTGGANWQGPKQVGNGWQFKDVFAAGDGVVYAVTQDGKLLWYRHDGFNTGTSNWQGPKQVGNGWQNFKQIIPAGGGVILAIQNDGTLLWYRHNGYRDGTVNWEGPTKVGTGWQNFKEVFAVIPDSAGPVVR